MTKKVEHHWARGRGTQRYEVYFQRGTLGSNHPGLTGNSANPAVQETQLQAFATDFSDVLFEFEYGLQYPADVPSFILNTRER